MGCDLDGVHDNLRVCLLFRFRFGGIVVAAVSQAQLLATAAPLRPPLFAPRMGLHTILLHRAGYARSLRISPRSRLDYLFPYL